MVKTTYMMKWIVNNLFAEKNKLLGGRDSFFSGEPGGVVVSDPALINTLHREGEPHVDMVFLLLNSSNDSHETLLFIGFCYVCYLHYHTLTLLLLDFQTIHHQHILGYLELAHWC